MPDDNILDIFSGMPNPSEYFRETQVRSFRVARETIWYLHFIFEAYDGVATISTVDSRKGLIELRIPESRVDEAEMLLRDLARKIHLEELS